MGIATVYFERSIWEVQIGVQVKRIESTLHRPTNAQNIFTNNILYIVSTATCFDTSGSSSGSNKLVFV